MSSRLAINNSVIPGLVPGTHAHRPIRMAAASGPTTALSPAVSEIMGPRHKAGDDGNWVAGGVS